MNEIVVAQITIGISTIPILVALYRKSYLNKALWVFLTYKILSLAVNLAEQFFIWYATKHYESLAPYLNYFGIGDTNFIGILYHILVFVFIGKYYRLLLGKINYGNVVLWISYALLLAVSINYFFIEGYRVYGKFNHVAVAVFMAGSATFYLYHLYRSNLALPIARNPYFWISIGIILPNLIGIFLFITGGAFHQEDYRFFTILTSFKNIFLIFGHVLVAIGFYHAPYTRFITLPDEK